MVMLYSDFTPMVVKIYTRKSYRRGGHYARRYRKTRRFGRRRTAAYGISNASNRYSRETTVFSATLPSALTPSNQLVVPPTDIQGVRYVSNFVVDICSTTSSVTAPATPVYWALQFVPQGQHVSNINSSNQAQILMANQFVIDAGVLNTSNQRIRVSTKYGRNLNSGDSVYLCLMQNVSVGSLVLQGLVAYSVAFK